MKQIIFTFLLSLGAMSISAQTSSFNEGKAAEYRHKIGLDMSVSDYEIKKIDAEVMGERLAKILDHFIANYKQAIYGRKIASITASQHKELENVYFEVKKLKYKCALKKENEINIVFKVWLGQNKASIKQTSVIFHFVDGVSEDRYTNELFSTISSYVKARRLTK